MSRLYKQSDVDNRIRALSIESASRADTIHNTFTNPTVRGAAWVGLWLATFLQLTGIDAVMFYSGQLFVKKNEDGEIDGLLPAHASCIINWSNFLACINGMALLAYFGRRSLMVKSYIFSTIGLVGMFFFQEVVYSQSMLMLLTVIFIIAF